MKFSQMAAATVVAAAVVTAAAVPATADGTPGSIHAGHAPTAGSRTSTAGSLEPYADSYGLFQWGGPNTLTAITLKVRPIGSRCDGRKIGIRLVTVPYHGAKHYWPCHGYTTGCGRTCTYNPHAFDSNGIHYVTVELGVFSGSTLKGTRDAPLSRRPSA